MTLELRKLLTAGLIWLAVCAAPRVCRSTLLRLAEAAEAL